MKTKKILNGVLLVIVLAIIIMACYKNKNNYNSPGGNNTVTMKNSVFSPANLTVVTGSTVTWKNDDNTIHTVTANDGSFDSGDIAIGSSYTKTFSSAATINYHDTHNTSMTGVLIITTSPGGY